MAYGRWTGLVQDALGNAVAGALVEVRRESNGALATLYADREGTVGLANPFVAPEATIFFHAAGGACKIDAFKDGYQQTWRYAAVGTAGEFDIEALEQRIDDGLDTALRPVEQDFDDAEQEQFRLNIGAASAEDVDEQLDNALRGDVSQASQTDEWRQQVWANAKQGIVKLLGGTVTPGAATLDIPLPSGFGSYEIVVAIRPSANAGLYARLSSDGGATFDTAGYSYRLEVPHSGTASYFTREAENAAFILAALAVGADSTIRASFTVTHPEIATAKPTVRCYGETSSLATSQLQVSQGAGLLNVAKAINAIRLYAATGAISSGSYEVYGYV